MCMYILSSSKASKTSPTDKLDLLTALKTRSRRHDTSVMDVEEHAHIWESFNFVLSAAATLESFD